MPVLHLHDGTKMYESNAIFRYLGKIYKGRKEETLYPGADDPDLTFAIDDVLETCEALIPKFRGFLNPNIPDYKDKEKHFDDFKKTHFPKFLETMENKLKKNDDKYIATDHMTLADIAVASHLLRAAYNEQFEDRGSL